MGWKPRVLSLAAKPGISTPTKSTEPTGETTPSSAAVVDDAKFDWGTRYRPDRNTPQTQHLGGIPTTVESVNAKLDEPLPYIDPEKIVIPAANVPLEILVQKLVDKALTEKEKSELTYDEVHPPVPSLSPEEAEAAAKADAEATEAAKDVKTTP